MDVGRCLTAAANSHAKGQSGLTEASDKEPESSSPQEPVHSGNEVEPRIERMGRIQSSGHPRVGQGVPAEPLSLLEIRRLNRLNRLNRLAGTVRPTVFSILH